MPSRSKSRDSRQAAPLPPTGRVHAETALRKTCPSCPLKGSCAVFLIDYGEHNANRLKPYERLDLSVNYKWYTSLFREQGLNLSVYNVMGRGNELFYYVSTKAGADFAYKPISFVVDVLPSISYFCKF